MRYEILKDGGVWWVLDTYQDIFLTRFNQVDDNGCLTATEARAVIKKLLAIPS